MASMSAPQPNQPSKVAPGGGGLKSREKERMKFGETKPIDRREIMRAEELLGGGAEGGGREGRGLGPKEKKRQQRP